MIETLGTDFVHDKGLPEGKWFINAPASSFPVVTLAGLQFSAVVSGAVVVEAVLAGRDLEL